MTDFNPPTVRDGEYWRLACTFCGKSVSSPLIPIPTEFGHPNGDPGFIVRALIVCPDCWTRKAGE